VPTPPRPLQYEEHTKRAWSVDFSLPDPSRLASGSDDGTVRLWSIHQEASVATMETRHNVCSVQFSPDAAHLLAAGSVNHKVPPPPRPVLHAAGAPPRGHASCCLGLALLQPRVPSTPAA
jgi:hypothetical protein